MQTSHPPSVASRSVLPPTYLLVTIVSMAALHLLVPWRRVIPFPWSLVGIVPVALGVALDLVADAALEKHGTTVKPFEKSSSLVTTGAYRVCRHPMYLGFVLILSGLATLMGSVTPFVLVLAFVVLIERTSIRVEEQMMAATFGEAWREYAARVGRWM